jgi:hypothetical protein
MIIASFLFFVASATPPRRRRARVSKLHSIRFALFDGGVKERDAGAPSRADFALFVASNWRAAPVLFDRTHVPLTHD